MEDVQGTISEAACIKKKTRSIGRICRGNCAKLKGTKCSIFTDCDRLRIFEEFWSKYYKKNDRHNYLNNLIDNLPSENEMPKYSYYLRIDNNRVKVCREMFLNTLGISIKMLKFPKENSKNIKKKKETILKKEELNTNIDIPHNSNQKQIQALTISDKKAKFKNKIITKDIGIQCDLLKELWNNFTQQYKIKFSVFENFLNVILLSDNKVELNGTITQNNEPLKIKPKTRSKSEKSLTDSETKGSIAESLGYQKDVHTIKAIEIVQECRSSGEKPKNYQPKITKRKIFNNYSKTLNGFKCLKCYKVFYNKSAVIEHLNLHLEHSKNRQGRNSIICKNQAVQNVDINYKNLLRERKKMHLNSLSKRNIVDPSAKPKEKESSAVYYQLDKNLKEKFISETFYCKICDIDFGGNRSEKHFASEKHLQNENIWIRKFNIKKFICLKCKMEFEILLELVRHQVKKHQKRISFFFFERLENFNLKYCYICDKSFMKRINYFDHMNMHKKLYAYACSCGKKFQIYNSLDYHSKKHGCPIEGRLLPNYFSLLYSNKTIKNSVERLNNMSNKNSNLENKLHQENNKEYKYDSIKSRRIIDITGNISRVKEDTEVDTLKETENMHGCVSNGELPKNVLTHQSPIIYISQLFNKNCVLDRNQNLCVPDNQIHVYETISQPNVIQLPQILNLTEIGQALQIPFSKSNNTKCSHFNGEFNEMINLKSNTIIETSFASYSKRECESSVSRDQFINVSVKNYPCGNDLKINSNQQSSLSLVSGSDIELDTNDANESDHLKNSWPMKKQTFYCELCRLNYTSSMALRHFYDINHRKLEDEWRKIFNIDKITCPLCPRTTFDKFFGLICHQFKVHGIKVDKFFFKKYKETFLIMKK